MFSRRLIWLALLFGVLLPAQDVAKDISLVYSGRFFGYFRSPDVQALDTRNCDASNLSAAAEKYIHELKDTPKLRVSMGDNFSPEFLSREIWDKSLGSFQPRDLYTPEEQSAGNWTWVRDDAVKAPKTQLSPAHGIVPFDNVGCFLKLAEFRAIVPGKDDFYFGPERLKEIGNYLWEAPPAAVRMLGANLTVLTTRRNANKPTPLDEQDGAVSKSLTNSFRSKIEMPATVFPWVQYFMATTDVGSVLGNGCLLPTTDDIDPTHFDVPENAQLCPPDRVVQSAPVPFKDAAAKKQPAKAVFQYSVGSFSLQIGKNYAFCLFDKKGNPACKTFSVAEPFFQLRHPDAEQDKPYYVDRDVVIFGVVDEQMQQQIGLLNYSWRNVNKSYDTKATIVSARPALLQAWQACVENKDCGSEKRKILLAQMPTGTLEDLLASLEDCKDRCGVGSRPLTEIEALHFDLAIAQVDGKHPTETTMISRPEGKTFVLAPAPHYQLPFGGHAFSVNTQKVSLTQLGKETHFKNETNITDVAPRNSEDIKFIYKKVQTRVKSSTERKDWEALVLQSMQRACRSDLALIQPRDVFAEDYPTSVGLWPVRRSFTDQAEGDELYSIDNLVDEVVWKGDFYFCHPISGASLKKAMAQSKKLANTPTTLSVIGADEDVTHQTYIVHGKPLDEKAVYTVALTDYLAFGDTQYPDLASTDLTPPDNVQTIKEYRTLGDLVAHNLGTVRTRSALAVIKPQDYFDRSAGKPADRTAGFNWLEQNKDWAKHWLRTYDNAPALLSMRKKPANPAGGAESKSPGAKTPYDAHNQPRYFFNMEKLTLEYDLTTIGGNQQLVPSRFGLVTNVSQLQNLEEQKVTGWSRIRFGREFHFFDVYGMTENRIGFDRKRQKPAQTTTAGGTVAYTDPYSVSFQDNFSLVETGLLTKPISERVGVRLLVAERVTTQLWSPLLSYQVTQNLAAITPSGAQSNCGRYSTDTMPATVNGNTTSVPVNVSCSTPRSFLRETRLGARLENQASWLEVGWENGDNYHSTSDTYFNKNTGSQVQCPVTQALSTCISNNAAQINQLSPVYVSNRILPVSGGFLNFNIVVPLLGDKFKLSLENYTEFFTKRSADNLTDTRFYEDAILKLPIKIVGNLSLSPQVEIFNFQNKVTPNHFLSLTSQFTLDYSFGWHSGTTSRRIFAFPYPDSTKSKVVPAP